MIKIRRVDPEENQVGLHNYKAHVGSHDNTLEAETESLSYMEFLVLSRPRVKFSETYAGLRWCYE